jgi:Rrf2 family protein
MKITKKGEYGLRAILALACVYGERTLTLRELSSREKLPLKFLEQIMMILKKNNLVTSIQGKFGGYSLARPPQEITLGEAIRAIEGPLAPMMSGRELEKRIQRGDRHAGLFAALFEVRNAISDVLDKKTLADICELSLEIARSKSHAEMYYI